jgi:hypothetical protein
MTRPTKIIEKPKENCVICGTPTYRKAIVVQTMNEELKNQLGEHKTICATCQGAKSYVEI